MRRSKSSESQIVAILKEAEAGLGRYLTLYSTRRRHSSLADTTPDEAYVLTLRSPFRVAA